MRQISPCPDEVNRKAFVIVVNRGLAREVSSGRVTGLPITLEKNKKMAARGRHSMA
ncbi:MAG TPA: hypothetical protein PKM75_09830 [Prolixibacteraceae bacterium]|nr:hypothetical protein [Prolixibacteraceae bacterium]